MVVRRCYPWSVTNGCVKVQHIPREEKNRPRTAPAVPKYDADQTTPKQSSTQFYKSDSQKQPRVIQRDDDRRASVSCITPSSPGWSRKLQRQRRRHSHDPRIGPEKKGTHWTHEADPPWRHQLIINDDDNDIDGQNHSILRLKGLQAYTPKRC